VLAGNPRFFLGSDSASHISGAKQSCCGSPGVFSSPVLLPLLKQFFDEQRCFWGLPGFTSTFGCDFYELRPSNEEVQLVRESWVVPDSYPARGESLVPFYAGQRLNWRVVD